MFNVQSKSHRIVPIDHFLNPTESDNCLRDITQSTLPFNVDGFQVSVMRTTTKLKATFTCTMECECMNLTL